MYTYVNVRKFALFDGRSQSPWRAFHQDQTIGPTTKQPRISLSTSSAMVHLFRRSFMKMKSSRR